jgi:hypothetical protein
MTVTTTHDPFGGGRPRLIFACGGSCSSAHRPREFDLRQGVTTIGSHDDSDLLLTGVAPRHAEIRRDVADEYRFIPLAGHQLATVNGKQMAELLLRSGSRIQLGTFTFTFFREEFADHGRPYGGRQGGEGSIQRHQPFPRLRGTTVDGGCAQTETDPGEYF